MIWKTVNRFNQKIVLVKRRQWIMLLEHDKFAKCSSFDLSWESFKEVRSEEVSRRSFQGRGFKKIKTDFAKRQPVCRVDNVRPLSCYSHPLRSLSFIRCVSLAAYHSLRITRLHYSRRTSSDTNCSILSLCTARTAASRLLQTMFAFQTLNFKVWRQQLLQNLVNSSAFGLH